MRKRKKGLSFISGLLMVGILAACGDADEDANSAQNGTEPDADANNGEITIGQINWAENIAVTNMWKVILEDKGYEVDLTLLDMGATMMALSSDELDASLEIWLPVQDANYLEEYEDTINFSEATWFDNAQVGLVVPEYLEDINSVEDLNANKELFDGQIIGFDPGAGTMEVTEQLIEDYNLDFELLPSTEPAMIAEIGSKIENEEPIVSPLWSPHWVFSDFDLKFLDDPKNTFGETEKIHHATRLGFEDDYPEVSEWFNNWKMDDQEIAELINYVEGAEDPLDGAAEWIDENQDLIGEWVN
ncbi:glycine betaine ABC transporter substrate-binding protein [Evansella clarkii]|uniref:glycine betaine ABC transporter substrate-binding protein n=1 Tax=Evansella clarkii TaxID=79879 RepID=UPI000B44E8F5|nr:glycine betaine ABC transporter substrate-binding protein [Evansella clarkii]